MSRTLAGCRYLKTSASGNECCGPSDSSSASSVAAACSSKLNWRQKRLRRASAHALLTRLPKGACSTSCMPPDSSKKRSSTSVFCVGITPSDPAPGSQIRHRLFGGAGIQAGFGAQPVDACPAAVFRVPGSGFLREPQVGLVPQLGHGERELVASCRRLAEPERDRRWRAVRIANSDGACHDLGDLPRSVAQLERCHPPCSRWRSPRSTCR